MKRKATEKKVEEERARTGEQLSPAFCGPHATQVAVYFCAKPAISNRPESFELN